MLTTEGSELGETCNYWVHLMSQVHCQWRKNVGNPKINPRLVFHNRCAQLQSWIYVFIVIPTQYSLSRMQFTSRIIERLFDVLTREYNIQYQHYNKTTSQNNYDKNTFVQILKIFWVVMIITSNIFVLSWLSSAQIVEEGARKEPNIAWH